MNKDEFLDKVIGAVKYRGVHKYLREELSAHIDEAAECYEREGLDRGSALQKATLDMGDPVSLGATFNKEYRMPFNSRYGLGIWNCISTCVIYFLIYPITVMLNNRDIPGIAPVPLVAAMFILFALANYMILRRGHLMPSACDVRDIVIGFFCGAVLSLVVLFGWSVFNEFGYYPYADGIEILFLRPVHYLGSEIRFFGDEMLILLFWLAIYLVSCKVNTKAKGFEFVVNLGDSVYPHYVDSGRV